MIVKLTVHDNDFYYKIMKFIKIMWEPIYGDDEDIEIKVDEHLKSTKIFTYINPNYDTKITPEIKEEIITYLKEQFNKFLDVKCDNVFADTKEYLKQNFEVSIQNSFTDRWENGEAFYWFQHSGAIINQ